MSRARSFPADSDQSNGEVSQVASESGHSDVTPALDLAQVGRDGMKDPHEATPDHATEISTLLELLAIANHEIGAGSHTSLKIRRELARRVNANSQGGNLNRT